LTILENQQKSFENQQNLQRQAFRVSLIKGNLAIFAESKQTAE